MARYLNGSRGGTLKDAALVAFVAPDSPDWRFSLIRWSIVLNKAGTGGQSKGGVHARPALVIPCGRKRRQPYCPRAVSAPILANDEHNPALKELEEAFNIEGNEEFFEEYPNLSYGVKNLTG